MPSIFISYRRADSAAITGRIHDYLENTFDSQKVFMDVQDIPAGVDFREELANTLATVDIVLVVIGPDWANITDESGNKRLFDPDDYVRLEVETALIREEVRVIPLLVDNAKMPTQADLPESLHPLVFRNALLVRNDPDFRRDMERLETDLRKILLPDSIKKTMDNNQNWIRVFGAIGALFLVVITLQPGMLGAEILCSLNVESMCSGTSIPQPILTPTDQPAQHPTYTPTSTTTVALIKSKTPTDPSESPTVLTPQTYTVTATTASQVRFDESFSPPENWEVGVGSWVLEDFFTDTAEKHATELSNLPIPSLEDTDIYQLSVCEFDLQPDCFDRYFGAFDGSVQMIVLISEPEVSITFDDLVDEADARDIELGDITHYGYGYGTNTTRRSYVVLIFGTAQ